MPTWFFRLTFLNQLLLIYLVIINVITFFYFGLDKFKANFKFYRVSERRLWFLSIIGGSAGAWLGMNFFYHKTKKTSFQAVFLLIFLVQVTMVFLLVQ
jgi:uncharacterized membrane protein YsdA (DUF1294 family)